MEEYTLFFTPFTTQGEEPAITQQEIIELAERIDADHVLYDEFAKRQARILQYAAEIAAIKADGQLTKEQKVADLAEAIKHYAQATSLYEEDVENALADNGDQPAFSQAVCELFALLSAVYVEEIFDVFIKHPSVAFPEVSFSAKPDVVAYYLGYRHYLVFSDAGIRTVKARSVEEALESLAESSNAEGDEPSNPIKITDADDARLSIKYAMQDWEDETGNTWADDHPDFQAEYTAYLDAEF